MPLMDEKIYIESLKKLKLDLYVFGKKVSDPTANPVIRPSLNSVAKTYSLANDPKYSDFLTATSGLTGKKINRFTHIFQDKEDLVKKVKMQRLLGQKTASCFQRCVGMDAANAIYSTTFEIDQKYNTDYHEKFKNYWKYIQENDLTVDGAMTDPKGDRSLPAGKQPDKDMYLRVIKRSGDGILVRGAKLHQTGVVNSHEIIVMPTAAMNQDEADWAISFALPTDTKGIIIIYGRQASDTRKLEKGADIDLGNKGFGGHEAVVVFDDVFVPNERIFLNGQTDFASVLVERFAGYHRQSYGGCKVGIGDVLIGAAALSAEYNGVAQASHIRDKLIEMVHLNETLYSCGLACSYEGNQTKSGNYQIDLLLANVCKQNVTRFPYEITRLAEDIAGGLMVTLPSEKDFKNRHIGHYLKKYLKGSSMSCTEDRIRILRFIENICLGSAAVAYRTESMHGAGSPQAQRIMIARQTDMEEKKEMAKKIAGIL